MPSCSSEWLRGQPRPHESSEYQERVGREGLLPCMFMRLGYFGSKIRRAWSDGTLLEKARRFLATAARRPFEVITGYIRLRPADRRLDVRGGFADHRGEAGHHRSDPDHILRIIAAYAEAKKRQDTAPAVYQIRGLWAEWIAVNFAPLIRALESREVSRVSSLLENLFREPFTTGLGGFDASHRYDSPFGAAYVKHVWSRYRDTLLSLGGRLDDVYFPLVGNPTGVIVKGRVLSYETLRHAYHAEEMTELLRGIPHPNVVEIGAGLGGQAYQTLRLRALARMNYFIFDIPEVCALSSYFLMSALPERPVVLCGEEAMASDERGMICVRPHFEISHLADSSVDLFYNSCSFSEMDSAVATEYLAVIERACRRYFLHDNHDSVLTFRNSDGTVSSNRVGSDLVPDPRRFKRIYKKPRVHGLPEDRSFLHYEYLYERLDS
jgi:hypothetical protein